jgi:hypothetical protein
MRYKLFGISAFVKGDCNKTFPATQVSPEEGLMREPYAAADASPSAVTTSNKTRQQQQG